MKKKTKIILMYIIGVPILIISILITLLFIKLKYDFPAQTDGLNSLLSYTNVKLSNREVYVCHEGWSDTQSYYKFTATQPEINLIVKKQNLLKTNNKTHPYRRSFYWWELDIKTISQHYEKLEGDRYWHLYYNPKNETAYYCFLGT